jgi:hypothetical protein
VRTTTLHSWETGVGGSGYIQAHAGEVREWVSVRISHSPRVVWFSSTSNTPSPGPLDLPRPGVWDKPQCRDDGDRSEAGPGRAVSSGQARPTHHRGLTRNPCLWVPLLYLRLLVGPGLELCMTGPMGSDGPPNSHSHPPFPFSPLGGGNENGSYIWNLERARIAWSWILGDSRTWPTRSCVVQRRH